MPNVYALQATLVYLRNLLDYLCLTILSTFPSWRRGEVNIDVVIVIPSGVPPAQKERSWMWESWSLLFGSAVVFWIADVAGGATPTLFEHRVVTFYSLCNLNIGSLLSIRVLTYIDSYSKTCPKLVQYRSKIDEHRGLGGVGSMVLIIGMLLAGPMDAWGRFQWI